MFSRVAGLDYVDRTTTVGKGFKFGQNHQFVDPLDTETCACREGKFPWYNERFPGINKDGLTRFGYPQSTYCKISVM